MVNNFPLKLCAQRTDTASTIDTWTSFIYLNIVEYLLKCILNKIMKFVFVTVTAAFLSDSVCPQSMVLDVRDYERWSGLLFLYYDMGFFWIKLKR